MPSEPRRGRSTARGDKPPLTLATEITYLKGAGPVVAQKLRTLGLNRVHDLLFHLPLRYEDRRAPTTLGALRAGEDALVLARVTSAEVRIQRRRVLLVVLEQEHSTLLLRFFHFNDSQRASFEVGRWVRAFGTARMGGQGMEMVHPEYRVAERSEDLPAGEGLLPVYPTTNGVAQPRLRAMVGQALAVAAADEPLRTALPGFTTPDTLAALQALHRPSGPAELAAILGGGHPAQQRLIREELLAHQLGLRLARRRAREAAAPPLRDVRDAVKELVPQLGFPLTRAQQRVIGEIGADLRTSKPMLRLVQGDVGSGKTAVAAVALLACARAGFQAALMAPTELLAEQHASTLARWFAPLGVTVAFIAGKLDRASRNRALAAVARAEAQIVVGTHALFQGEVRFAKLGLIVVDEQHRFGVGQRLSLRDKGGAAEAGGADAGLVPHQLVLSATPIPRTLAQTLYADLDVSQIDELPPGRTPVQTVALSGERRAEVLARIGGACAQGRQAYWVCTLIDESEQLEAQAAEVTYQTLRTELPQLQVGLVHGRLKASEKEAVMRAFKEGAIQLLVATTVIEVGVDVPNASIMIIEDAQRLGLSQLHQLRGRVGRGAQASQCVLLYHAPLSDNAKARLATMRNTNDGFEIARRDLELRGPGELLGRRQTGLVGLKLADPLRDADQIPELQRIADDWLDRELPVAKVLIERWIGIGDRYADV
jgi:ATP-dependent DNA helicase RecG